MHTTDDRPSGRLLAGLPHRRGLWRRLGPALILLATFILIVDALVGDKGLLERVREGRRHQAIASELLALQQKNAALREQARQLREEEPASVETAARKQLGMIKRGEVLFIIKDLDREKHDAIADGASPDRAPSSSAVPAPSASAPRR